jgi:CAAX protease family protein
LITRSSASAGAWRTAWGVGETIAVFAVVHLAYRTLKHFSAVGRWEGAAHTNFTPGVVMAIAAVGMIWLRGADFSSYGITRHRWARNLNLGLVVGALLIGGAGALAALNLRANHPLEPPSFGEAAVYVAGALLGLIAIAVSLRRRDDSVTVIGPPLNVALLAVALVLPIAIAWHFEKPVSAAVLTVLWCFFGAGCGEEIFFRGYVQSRVNEACGRPWRLLGIRFGWGLIVSSLLFGCVHALNTVDYFHGRFAFAWAYGLESMFVGLFYGALREKSGSLVTGAVVHGLVDVWARVPAIIPASI